MRERPHGVCVWGVALGMGLGVGFCIAQTFGALLGGLAGVLSMAFVVAINSGD